MKTSKRNKLLGLALTGGFSLFGASGAFAAAGDTVSNFATLQYSVGTAPQTVIESGFGGGNSVPGAGYAVANNLTTDFLEDRVINFTVVREGGTVSVAPNATVQAIPFLIDNTGNGAHGFLLVGVHNLGLDDPFGGAADNFTPATSPFKTYVDSDNNGTLDPGEIADANSFIPTFAPGAGLGPGGTIRVFVVADIPADSRVPSPLVNDDIAVVSLVAHASVDGTSGIIADAIISDDNANNSPGGTFNGAAGPIAIPAGAVAVENPDGTGTMETVFNDTATTDPTTGATVDANNNVDVNQNAQQSSFSSFTIVTAELTVAKTSAVIWDFVNLDSNPKSIPGGGPSSGPGGGTVIRYTVTVSNAAGAADATLTTIVDDLPLSISTQLSDGTAANGPVSLANNVRITDGAGTSVFCQADPGDAAPADGCDSALGGTVDRLQVDLAAVAGITPVLQAGETLTIEFDVILP